MKSLDSDQCEIKITLNWFNKNPFKSMFWAAQGMAAELTTALMITDKIRKSGHNISMLFCLLYTSPSPRDRTRSRMPSSA